MMRKVANMRKEQGPQSRMKNKTHFSLQVFDSDVQDAILYLLSVISTKCDLPSF